jgi:carbonic anhydrase
MKGSRNYLRRDCSRLVNVHNPPGDTLREALSRYLSKTCRNNTASILITSSDFPFDMTSLDESFGARLYIVRTPGGLIPQSSNLTDLSVGAALEYGVKILKARQIIQMGYTKCGILEALIKPDAQGTSILLQGEYLPEYLKIIRSSIAGSLGPKKTGTPLSQCLEELLRLGFENLMTYPWILDSVWTKSMTLHGCYIDYQDKNLLVFSPETDSFESISYLS